MNATINITKREIREILLRNGLKIEDGRGQKYFPAYIMMLEKS